MNIPRNPLFILAILSLILAACQDSGPIAGVGSLSLYGIPLTISINSRGEISFEVQSGVRIPTPIGVVTAGVVIDPAKYYDVPNTLTVRIDGQDYIYNLNGEDFQLELESGYYEEIAIRKEGKDLFLEVQSRGNAGFSKVIIPIHEKFRLFGDTAYVTIDRIEREGKNLNIYFEVTASKSDLEYSEYTGETLKPNNICIKERTGLISFHWNTLSPTDIVTTTNKKYHVQGYVEFSRSAFSKDGTYYFHYDCNNDWAWVELPLE